MVLKVSEKVLIVKQTIEEYFEHYNIIHQSKLSDQIYFLVIEKYYLRIASRVSLSMIFEEKDYNETMITVVGSGGGRSWLVKHNWGASAAFEKKIKHILDNHEITYQEVE